jgi:alpha-glucosidase/alpha-D-xyloside xylohydrolase
MPSASRCAPQRWADSVFWSPGVVDTLPAQGGLSIRSLTKPTSARVGSLSVEVPREPAHRRRETPKRATGADVVFADDGTLSFALDDQPVLGMGEGGPRPEQGKPWRQQPIQFDRRGRSTRWSRAGRATPTGRAIR